MPKIDSISSFWGNLASNSSLYPRSILSMTGRTLSEVIISGCFPSSHPHCLVLFIFHFSSSLWKCISLATFTRCLAPYCLSFYLLSEKNLLCKLFAFRLPSSGSSLLWGVIVTACLSTLSVLLPCVCIVTLWKRAVSLLRIVMFWFSRILLESSLAFFRSDFKIVTCGLVPFYTSLISLLASLALVSENSSKVSFVLFRMLFDNSSRWSLDYVFSIWVCVITS